MNKSARMEREAATVEVMIRQYCQSEHSSQEGRLCADCEDLLSYARKRLDSCPFQDGKTTCGNCPIHCYKSDMREKIREVMRTIGPRLLWSHPIMALRHAIDGFRKKPIKVKKS